jgi:hypothetical protein
MTSDQPKVRPAWGGLPWMGGRRRRPGAAFATRRRREWECRWARVATPWVEGLESRRLLATITWNTTAAPTGGEWNDASNWNGGVIPASGDTAVISGLTSPGIVTLTGASDSVSSLTTDSSVNLEVITGSLALGAGSSSTFGGPATVVQGASLTVGAGANVTIAAGQTLTDNGALTFAAGDTVSMGAGCCTQTIAVDGTLTAADTTFTGGNGQITVGSGGNLMASGSTFSITQLSLANSSVLNAGDLTGDAFNMPIDVPYNDVQYLGGNANFNQVNINAGTITGGTLDLDLIGTSTAGLSYAFPGGFTVASGATVAVGPNVPVTIDAGQTITDNGALTFAAGDTVSMGAGCCTQTIAVDGTLTAAGTTFTGGNGQVTVGSGGHLEASGSTFSITQLSLADGSMLDAGDWTGDTFNMPIDVPYNDVQYLGDNLSFDQVNINAATLLSGTLDLDLIGTTSIVNLSYAFPGGFTVASGATVAVGPNVPVTIDAGQTITDNGALTFAAGDTVSMGAGCCTQTIAVDGTLTAADTTFTGGNGQITVNSGGNFNLSDSNFGLTSLTLNSGSTDTITTVVLSSTLNVNSNATIDITDNDFSNVPSNGVVASGDANADINLVGNYWGSTVVATIESKIVDHTTNANLPTIEFQPFAIGTSAISASPAAATFSESAQTINLMATVDTTAGAAINEGTVTFTILQGSQVIGQTTAPANVSNGAVTAAYTLPGGTPTGQYTIEATYSDSSGNYVGSTDTTHFLTIAPASTTATTAGVSATFSVTSSQSIALSAQVSSGAGVINEGSVTFTILSGGNAVGSPVSANVAGGAASVTYTLPAGTSSGSYTIQAVFSDPVDFATSTGTNTLAVAAAATTTKGSDAAAPAGQSATLTATVTSPAGTVNTGTVTFTVLSGTTTIGTPQVANVTNGSASASYSVPANTAIGTYTIQAVYGATSDFAASADSTHSLGVEPPAGSKLVINSPPPSTATAGQPFATSGQPVVVYVEDSSGQLLTSDNSTVVTATLGSGTGALTGTLSVEVVGGVATFTDLGENTAGSITLVFAGGGLTSPASGPIAVGPGAAAKLAIHIGPYATVVAGNPLTDPIVIYEEDQYGNLETGDNSTQVTASLASGAGTLIGTTQATVQGGIASFDDLEDNTAGTLSLQFSAGSLSPATSAPSVVTPAAATQLVAKRPPGGIISGKSFALVVDAEDPYGNVDTSYSAPVTVSGSGGSLSGTLTQTAQAGVADFPDLATTTGGAVDLTATSGNLTSASTGAVPVSAAAPAKLVVQVQPPSTATVGQPFATSGRPVVVYEEDQYGNIETGDNSTAVTVSLASGSGSLLGTLSVTLQGGEATFTDLADGAAGTITLAFSGGGLPSVTSNPISVSPLPTITGEQVVMTKKHKKGKPTLQGFTIDYSTAMNPATAGLAANYQMTATSTKRVKKRTITVNTPVAFSAVYNPATNSVTLLLSGKQAFAKGGEISVNYAPPNGVSGASGVALDSNDTTLTIQPKGRAITAD